MKYQYKILAINPGSTSTKIAVYADETCLFEETIRHSTEELAPFARINDQYEFRRQLVEKVLTTHDIKIEELSAVVGRGGPLKPIPSGTYIVNDTMCEDLRAGVQAEHASNLGGLIARGIADQAGIPAFIVDPVSVDEFEPLARITGIPEIQRRSLFHALNLKAVAHRVACDLGRDYHSLNLIMVHLGGGISVGIQQGGRMIDVANPNETGPFSPERAGAVPTGDLVKMCYSGKYTLEQMKKKLVGSAGLVAHLGTNDGREIERRINAGDKHAALVYEAMAYQVAKEIGAMATVVSGRVDAIVLTGGLAHSKMLTGWISNRVRFIADVLIYPGEDEIKALVEGALRVLRGEEEAKIYQ
ncbi:acetate and butyrate kinase [Thermosinus carboxydivorans Nor1]|uniref:Probable butyrate kinase n=1 Tax=Thermosinus carboxydivorans Nor1 TaxID=401526 RepID=A1HTQ8_9FIRM|nr:butyrate kinase [Thermosinus carboxydivorans]EAX46608.1 acetate and butyrate kinase [Thermosinus carboxydivorans Nor1]